MSCWNEENLFTLKVEALLWKITVPHDVPSFAKEKLDPQAIDVTRFPTRSWMGVGIIRQVLRSAVAREALEPSWPRPLLPHPYATPAVVQATQWPAPAATPLIFSLGSIWIGVGALTIASTESHVPKTSSAFRPHAYTRLSSEIANEKSQPAATEINLEKKIIKEIFKK